QSLAETITYLRLGPEHLDMLCAVSEGLFDEPVDPVQAAAFLGEPGHEIILAMAGDLAVGMATGTVLLHPDKPPGFFVNEVGVRDAWLRRGIGKAMMSELVALARARGCE